MALPLTEETGLAQLDLLESRFDGTPARILDIDDRATVIDACTAFAALAEIHHPRRYVVLSPSTTHRAQRAYRRLQLALSHFIASIPDRPTYDLKAPSTSR